MNACERCQMELSSLWDGAASDRMAVRSALLHQADCADCRSFLRCLEALEGLVESAKSPGTEIAGTVRSSAVMPRRGMTGAAWLRAAAVLIALLGGAWLAGSSWLPSEAPVDQIEIELAGNRTAMSDARFLEIATELLEADHRYRHGMLQMLRQIETEVSGLEASLDEMVGFAEGNRERDDRPRV